MIVKLKWGMEYKGLLMAVDSYMNLQVWVLLFVANALRVPNAVFFLQLADAEEFIDGAFAGNLGEILIRCNNVMYMREAVVA